MFGSAELYKAELIRERDAPQRVSGMTSETERAYFKWHAQEVFTGKGTIVDLGSWFGSTTVALARGLVANPRPSASSRHIHAFDRYMWEPWMEPYAPASTTRQYEPGDSFLAEFEAAVDPWRNRIQIHAGDLLHEDWTGEPIELLLIDAMKSWELASRIVKEFFPALIAGDGYVIHQDFGHCFTPWIHLLTYRLRSHLVPTQDVAGSETVVFRVVRGVEHDAPLLSLSRASFDDDEVGQAFDYSRRITRPEKHSGIYAAQALLAVYDGAVARATQLLNTLENAGKLSAFHAGAVRGAIEGSEG